MLGSPRTKKNMAETKNAGAPRPQLTAVAEKTLQATRCKPGSGMLAYCPTMDLIALAAEDDQLHVFRLNGQRVFGGSFGGDPYLDEDAKEKGELRGLRWKNNGMFFYIVCEVFFSFFDIREIVYLLVFTCILTSLPSCFGPSVYYLTI